MDLDAFERMPLLGILRGIGADAVGPLAEVTHAAGLSAIEVTMNSANAAQLIRAMCAAARGKLDVGAGTVLDESDLDSALDAGASFIVAPSFHPGVVARCVAEGIPVFPGALTPSEVQRAWEAGATMVKLFPASAFGPAYLGELRGPFADTKILACGGVRADNAATYLEKGAAALAFGASVYRNDWIERGDYAAIQAEIEVLASVCRDALASRSGATRTREGRGGRPGS